MAAVLLYIASSPTFLHLCRKRSPMIEAPLVALSVAIPWSWIRRATTLRQGAWRLLGGIVVALSLSQIYLEWLHSDNFPQKLLAPRNRGHTGKPAN